MKQGASEEIAIAPRQETAVERSEIPIEPVGIPRSRGDTVGSLQGATDVGQREGRKQGCVIELCVGYRSELIEEFLHALGVRLGCRLTDRA